MSQIQDLDQTELERSLPDRLRRSAAAVTPDPDALFAVRARAAGRRRRSRVTLLAGSAAAIAVIAGGVVVATGDEPSTGLTAGPADGGTPTTVTAPVPTEAPDATLVIYRYPNATPEMTAQDPKMGGEWATLLTEDRRYHANGPLDELGAESPSEPSEVRRALDLIGPAHQVSAELLIVNLLDLEHANGSTPTVATDQAEPRRAASLLVGILASGAADAHEAAQVRRLIESLEGTSVREEADGTVTITESHEGAWVQYDPATGAPRRSGRAGTPETTIEYVSVTRVRAADVLVAGRGTPNASSTTTVPG